MKRRRALLLASLPVIALCTVCGVWLHRERQQYQRNRRLIAALEHQDARAALELVNAGADPNTHQYAPPAPTLKFLFTHLFSHKPAPFVDSDTALMLACGISTLTRIGTRYRWVTMKESLPLLTAMLAHGANVNAGTQRGTTPLHVAATSGRVRTAELLLKHGANINAQDTSGTTPLMMALTNSTLNTAHLLLAQGANPNMPDNTGESALYYTFTSPQAHSVIPDLLAHGADPNVRNNFGHTPLELALAGNGPKLSYWLKHGVWR